MFIEREMSRDQMQPLLFELAWRHSFEEFSLLERSWKRNAFCSFWFLDDKNALLGNSFRRKNFLIQTKLEKLLLGAAGEIFIHHHFERGMGTKLPYSLASMCISVLFAIRGHIGKKDLKCCVEIAFMPALKYAIDFLFNLRWKEQ